MFLIVGENCWLLIGHFFGLWASVYVGQYFNPYTVLPSLIKKDKEEMEKKKKSNSVGFQYS